MHRALLAFTAAAALLVGCSHSSPDLTAAQALGVTGPVSQAQAQAIAARHLSGTARSVKEETEDGETVYEVLVATGEGLREVAVRIADGAVLEIETPDGDGDDEARENDDELQDEESEAENGASVTPPEAVTAAFAAAYPSGTALRWSREADGFEASFLLGGTATSVVYAADGTAGPVETEIAVADLPAPVRDAATRAAAGAPITEAARIVDGGRTRYEAEVTRGGTRTDYIFEADGSLVEPSPAEAD